MNRKNRPTQTLANKPSLVLADEPTGNLDSQTGRLIVDLLKQLAKSHQTTIIVVTHDLGLAKQADLTFQLQDGRLVHDGKTVLTRSVKA